MERLEALSLVAVLQAAFPAGGASRETVELYAHQFERYEHAQCERAVLNLVETRREAFLPTWAEIKEAIIAERPRPKALPEPEGVKPTPEQQRVIDELRAAGERKTSELQHGVRLRFARDQAKEGA